MTTILQVLDQHDDVTYCLRACALHDDASHVTKLHAVLALGHCGWISMHGWWTHPDHDGRFNLAEACLTELRYKL